MQDGLESLNSNPLVSSALNLIPISQAGLMVGSFLFPGVKIPVSNVRYRTYDLGQASALVLDTLRALDAKAKEIRTVTDFAELGIDEYMLKTLIDDLKIREAGSLGVDFTAEQLTVIRELMVLAKEYRHAAIATSPANYSVDHKSLAYDFTAATIQEDFKEAAEVISGSVGRLPTGILFGKTAFNTVRTSAAVNDYFQPASGPRVRITEAMLAEFFDVPEVVVGRAGYRDDDSVFHPFWDNVAIMTVSDRVAPGLNNMHYGVTAYMDYDGILFDVRMAGPYGVERLWEAGCAERYRNALLNQDAGYLFAGA